MGDQQQILRKKTGCADEASPRMTVPEQVTSGCLHGVIFDHGGKPWWTSITHGEHGAGTLGRMCDMLRVTLLDITMTVDPNSGLARGTDIAAACKKRVGNWLALGSTQADHGTLGLAKQISLRHGIPLHKLAVVVENGEHTGSWVHMRLINSLASWCSPAYAARVDEIVMIYFDGSLTTKDSRCARDEVYASIRPASTADPASSNCTARQILSQPVAESTTLQARQSEHARVRKQIRTSSTAIEGLQSVPIPKHLLRSPGVYIGVWGAVEGHESTGSGKRSGVHLKLGKAVDQSLYERNSNHFAEKPHTYILLYVAGCDAGLVAIVESSLKRCARALGLERIGNSCEEFFVALDQLQSVLMALTAEIEQQHGDILVRADDVPVETNVELEKYRIDSEAKAQAEQDKLKFFAELMRAHEDVEVRKMAMDAIRELAIGNAGATQAQA